MAQTKLVGGSRTTTLEFTGLIDTDEPRVRTLDLHLAGHFASVDLQWFKVEPTGNPGGAHMDFTCDAFTLTEFQYHRDLRAHVITMLDVDLVSVDVTVT